MTPLFRFDMGECPLTLAELRLQNFKCYEHLSVQFDKRLTVIVGSNGAGKTTILEAAKIAIGTFFTKIDGISAPCISKDDARIKAYEMGDSDDVEVQYPVTVSARIQTKYDSEYSFVTRSLTNSKGKTTVNDAKKLVDYGNYVQQALRDGDPTLVIPVVAYYGTGRLWDYHRDKKSSQSGKSVSTRTNGYKDCLDGTANIKLMMHWFERKTIQSFQKKDEQETDFTLDAVLSAIGLCFENVSGHKQVKVRFNFDTKSLEVLYTDSDGRRMRLPFDQLSDGYKGTISLIADIAYRMATLNPQLKQDVLRKTPGIVLVDEVDLHLHPAWQKRILKDFTFIFPKVQFIVTTHAASVINSVKKESLVILKNDLALGVNSEVYGKDVESVMDEIMGVSDRPDDVEDLFKQFYKYLDSLEFEQADRVLDEIGELRGGHDPELAGCQVKLKLAKLRREK